MVVVVKIGIPLPMREVFMFMRIAMHIIMITVLGMSPMSIRIELFVMSRVIMVPIVMSMFFMAMSKKVMSTGVISVSMYKSMSFETMFKIVSVLKSMIFMSMFKSMSFMSMLKSMSMVVVMPMFKVTRVSIKPFTVSMDRWVKIKFFMAVMVVVSNHVMEFMKSIVLFRHVVTVDIAHVVMTFFHTNPIKDLVAVMSIMVAMVTMFSMLPMFSLVGDFMSFMISGNLLVSTLSLNQTKVLVIVFSFMFSILVMLVSIRVLVISGDSCS